MVDVLRGRGAAMLATLVFALASTAAAADRTVTIEGMRFAPATLTVKRGDTVAWENRDLVPHTATVRGVFDSGAIAAGQSWRWQAMRAGRFEVVCTLHPTMKAVLVVE